MICSAAWAAGSACCRESSGHQGRSAATCLPTGPLAGPSYLSALPCGWGAALHVQERQGTDQLQFRIVRADDASPTGGLIGFRVRIVNNPRARVPNCPAVLALNATSPHRPRPAAAAGGRNPACSRMNPQLGSLASLGAEQWVLEDARPTGSNSADLLVRIRTAVSFRVGALPVWQRGGHMGAGCMASAQ